MAIFKAILNDCSCLCRASFSYESATVQGDLKRLTPLERLRFGVFSRLSRSPAGVAHSQFAINEALSAEMTPYVTMCVYHRIMQAGMVRYRFYDHYLHH